MKVGAEIPISLSRWIKDIRVVGVDLAKKRFFTYSKVHFNDVFVADYNMFFFLFRCE